jgi:hypothetical protein
MLVSEGRTFRFRAMARYKTAKERQGIFDYVKGLDYPVALFDNTNSENTLLADFDKREERDAFHDRYNPPAHNRDRNGPVLKLVSDIKARKPSAA